MKSIAKQLLPIIKRYARHVELAGSYRRGATDIGDMDFIVTDADLSGLIEAIDAKFHLETVARSGDKIATIVVGLEDGTEAQIEFVNVSPKSVGAAMLHSTGSAQFNIGLRTYAKQKGYILSQYGLFNAANKKWVAGKTEEDIFNKLTLHYIPPKDRNGNFWNVKSKYKIRP